MLQLKNITKEYKAGDQKVAALRGISLSFRKSEFVCILGPSGCGKTTLLNIIGGLDQYSSGDLIIDGRSTKDYRDGDWDVYRNRSIGFVFQSYNLIPHQTVLANVELAMTLSGVSKAERRRRAVQALEQVGLGEQLNKKPNQLSGGQMQRVAIARALVNNPEILLADEPTGALDSETSVQIMELLKQVAADRLVIMVTHNPELAEQYATRTVRLFDGCISDDSAPFDPQQEPVRAGKKLKKKPMSQATAMALSARNLMTKKGRTFLTAFAGSIGIIGIALILALSNGIQEYIDQVQEDTLSSYPITIQEETVDYSALIGSMMGVSAEKQEHGRDAVYSSPVLYEMMDSALNADTQKNNLSAFKAWLESGDSEIREHLSAVTYSYQLGWDILAYDSEGTLVNTNASDMFAAIYGEELMGKMESQMSAQMSSGVFAELIAGADGELISDVVYDQYDLLYGSWPQSYDELVLVVDENNEISDMVLYALGLKPQREFEENVSAILAGEDYETELAEWSYEELCQTTFSLVLPTDYFQKNSDGTWTQLEKDETTRSYLYAGGTELRIVGVIRANEDATAHSISGAVGYTSALTQKMIEKVQQSEVVLAQQAQPETDVLSGLPFRTGDEPELTQAEKAADFRGYLDTLSAQEKAELYADYAAQAPEDYVASTVEQLLSGQSRADMEEKMISTAQEQGYSEQTIRSYLTKMSDEELMQAMQQAAAEQVRAQYAEQVGQQLAALTAEQSAGALDAAVAGMDDAQLSGLYDTYMPPVYSERSYEENLELLGLTNPDEPSSISLYAATFEDKDAIADCIDAYNRSVSEDDEISYTDYVALLMSSITTIINAISYVLIAFVAISLVVSSIMIGIITYISVLERTKEIGILRAIGASKKDVARVFNAETIIVGLSSGLLGIGVTLLLCIPVNAIIRKLTGIASLGAQLPWAAAVILVLISMLLTFIAGLIPSRMAAKKDPVTALRTE